MYNNEKFKAKPYLEKKQVLTILAQHLDKNVKTDIYSLRESVNRILRNDGIIGEITETHGNMTSRFTRRISDEDALLINECIYDLLYSRVITPGANESNLDLPHVHVSDKSKLNEYL